MREFVIYGSEEIIKFIEANKKEKCADRAHLDFSKIDHISKGYIAVKFVNYAQRIDYEQAIFLFGCDFQKFLLDS